MQLSGIEVENVGSVVSARVATGERDANGVSGESESCAGADGAPGSIAQRPRISQRTVVAPK